MESDTDRKNEEPPDGACAAWWRGAVVGSSGIEGMPVCPSGTRTDSHQRLQGGAAAFVTAQRGNARWHEPGTTARRGPQSTTDPHGSQKAS